MATVLWNGEVIDNVGMLNETMVRIGIPFKYRYAVHSMLDDVIIPQKFDTDTIEFIVKFTVSIIKTLQNK